MIKKNPSSLPTLEAKIETCFKNRTEVIAVYLFGSYAKGKERHLSDIDIGILLDEKDRDFMAEKRKEYTVELARVLRKDIHVVILNLAGEELLRQVFLKGKCLLINDSRKLARYKMVMFGMIAEFAFYRPRMQSGLIRKIVEG